MRENIFCLAHSFFLLSRFSVFSSPLSVFFALLLLFTLIVGIFKNQCQRNHPSISIIILDLIMCGYYLHVIQGNFFLDHFTFVKYEAHMYTELKR